jgi:hypothetical protein
VRRARKVIDLREATRASLKVEARIPEVSENPRRAAHPYGGRGFNRCEGHLSFNSGNAIASFLGHALIDQSCVNDMIFEPSLHYVISIGVVVPRHEIWDRFMPVGNSILKPWLFRSSPSFKFHH